MGYRVEYNYAKMIVKKSRRKKKEIHIVIMVLLILAGSIGAHIAGSIVQIMILGQGRAVYSAVEVMVHEVREGERVSDAVQTLYEILASA